MYTIMLPGVGRIRTAPAENREVDWTQLTHTDLRSLPPCAAICRYSYRRLAHPGASSWAAAGARTYRYSGRNGDAQYQRAKPRQPQDKSIDHMFAS
ncbi:hypothetical protein KCP71_14995 [Salmonella enterica subsp. enterica]|nr:hypothetical protein KCP71_14995 [Salmonella enterica subsp. enterica]